MEGLIRSRCGGGTAGILRNGGVVIDGREFELIAPGGGRSG